MSLSNAKLSYKGDGDYDAQVGDVTLKFSYDGSDHMVGDWNLWYVVVGGQTVSVHQILGPGPLTDWLEEQARKEGHWPDEPEVAHA